MSRPRRILPKFSNLAGRLPDDRRFELLSRLNAIEERNIAGIFSL